MGVFKKIFGGGYEAPKTQEVAPAPITVQTVDTSADTAAASTERKKRAGFASTQSGTVLTGADGSGGTRQTLG